MSWLPPALSRPLLAAALAAGAAGCAPSLRFNQTYLTQVEMKVSDKGFASLSTTGESFDLGPIRTLEGKADKVVLIKVHGTYFIAGEGFKSLWRLWQGGDDLAHYKPIEIEGAPRSGFGSPFLEVSGKCAVFSWTKGSGTEKRFVTTGGDVDTKGCPDA
jgi:hypothetical protein